MEGTVLRSTGSWYDIFTDKGQKVQGRLRGKFKMHDLKMTNPIAVGDRVIISTEGEEENKVLIEDILPRKNYIIRKSTRKTAHAHILASNIDQLLIIATLKMPRTSMGFVDRMLVAAESYEIPSIIFFNKSDLLDEEEIELLMAYKYEYEEIGYKCIIGSIENKIGIDKLNVLLEGNSTLVSGHSGAGKSTLINTLKPELQLKTSPVSSFANKGVHTTTYAEIHPLRRNTYIIDSPGIKEMGLFDIDNQTLSHYFPEMRKYLNECRFHNCMHTNEPGCKVKEAYENDEIASWRYENYLSMLTDDMDD